MQGSPIDERDLSNSLRSNDKQLRAIIDAIPQLVWSSLPDGYVDYCNSQWLAYTGLTEDAVKGTGWSAALHPDDTAPTLRIWSAATRTGEPYYCEQRLRHHDGTFRWFLTRANPLKNAEGVILKWYGTCTDIDPQKMAEAKLLLEARRKDDFIALLAHELRNPLAPIRTSVSILRRKISDEAIVSQCLSVMERQIATMARLLDDLLDISRINRGIIRLESKPLLIADILHAALETTRDIIATFHQTVHLQIPHEELVVVGDPVRLEQVFVNLLNNAAKYSQGPGTITITAEQQGDVVSIKVRDTGIGISQDLLPFIFEPFTQGERSVDRSSGGLGIGLNLTRSLLQLHHGDIQARSEGSGRGSEFEVRLPLFR